MSASQHAGTNSSTSCLILFERKLSAVKPTKNAEATSSFLVHACALMRGNTWNSAIPGRREPTHRKHFMVPQE